MKTNRLLLAPLRPSAAHSASPSHVLTSAFRESLEFTRQMIEERLPPEWERLYSEHANRWKRSHFCTKEQLHFVFVSSPLLSECVASSHGSFGFSSSPSFDANEARRRWRRLRRKSIGLHIQFLATKKGEEHIQSVSTVCSCLFLPFSPPLSGNFPRGVKNKKRCLS